MTKSDPQRRSGAQLGHESEATGKRSYTAKGTVRGSKHHHVLKVLAGGLKDA